MKWRRRRLLQVEARVRENQLHMPLVDENRCPMDAQRSAYQLNHAQRGQTTQQTHLVPPFGRYKKA